MSQLAEIAARVPDCLIAAWVDPRTATVIEQQVVRADPEVAFALDAATEVVRSPERPPRLVLLSARLVHIVQRVAADPNRVLVVICERSANVGFAVAVVRSMAEQVP